jgi:hypothetical protein
MVAPSSGNRFFISLLRAVLNCRVELRGRSDAGARRPFCVVAETYPPEINGVATALARLVSGLRAGGHRVSLVRPRQRGDAPGPCVEAATTLVASVRLPGYRGLQIGLPAGAALRAAWTRSTRDRLQRHALDRRVVRGRDLLPRP